MGALPEGVFYGMLGGLHPVCGAASAESSKHCELMLLSQPVAVVDKAGDLEAGAPFMPHKTLTVLGQVRDKTVENMADLAQCMGDAEKARQLLLERFAA